MFKPFWFPAKTVGSSDITLKVVQGGLEAPSGVKIASMGENRHAKEFLPESHSVPVACKLAAYYALTTLCLINRLTVQIGKILCSAGDTEDLMLLAVVAVTVGYGLRPEDLVEV